MSDRQRPGRERHHRLADLLLKHDGFLAFSLTALLAVAFLRFVSIPRIESWLLVGVGGGAVVPLINAYRRQHDLKHRISMASSLRGANFSGLQLASQYMRSRNLQKAKFSRANLSRADLTDADLYDARFVATRMANAYLGGANCVKTTFYRSQLMRANLDEIRTGEGTSFDSADLRNAKLRNADLRGATFKGADLRGATFEESVLRPDALELATTDASTILPDGRPAEPNNLESLDLRASFQRVVQLQGPNVVRSATFGLGMALAVTASISAAGGPGRPGMFDQVALPNPTRTASSADVAERVTVTGVPTDIDADADSNRDVGGNTDAGSDSAGADTDGTDTAVADAAAAGGDSAPVDLPGQPIGVADSAETPGSLPPLSQTGAASLVGVDGDDGTSPTETESESETESAERTDDEPSGSTGPAEPESSSESSPQTSPPTTDLSEAPLTEAVGTPGLPALVGAPSTGSPNQTAAVELSLTMESTGGTSSANYVSTSAQGTVLVSPQSPQVIDLSADGIITIEMSPESDTAIATCAISIDGAEQVARSGFPGQTISCEIDLSNRP